MDTFEAHLLKKQKFLRIKFKQMEFDSSFPFLMLGQFISKFSAENIACIWQSIKYP